jgi:hypothetical protein
MRFSSVLRANIVGDLDFGSECSALDGSAFCGIKAANVSGQPISPSSVSALWLPTFRYVFLRFMSLSYGV